MHLVRKLVFWLHLIVGLLAGLLVLVMSVTGVLMTFERQIIDRADSFKIHPASKSMALTLEEHLEILAKSKATPSAIGLERDPSRPASYQIGKDKLVFAHPYTGESLGSGNTAVRGFFRWVLTWHRFLGREGAAQPVGKTIIGTGNVMFLFLLVSGIFLWFPKRWTLSGIKLITLFQRRLKGRGRDWNWHNVFGFWAAIPLLVIVSAGTVIAFPWANALVFRIAGEQPPKPGERKKVKPAPLPADHTGINAALATAQSSTPDWQSIQLQLPFTKEATFAISESHRGRPDKRRQVTIDLASSHIVKTENFSDLSPARQARTWIRWIHTGEAGGAPGQTIAGLAAACSAMLVWTGLSLSARRFFKKAKN
jgi:uncharacterized iron-regulated membrane protein